MNLFSWITWDPNPVLFNLPIFNHPITWYGLFFSGGFLLGFLILVPLLKQLLTHYENSHHLAQFLADKITWYVIIGTVVGARLGHVFFYEWPVYKDNILDIFKVWEGGLASHGGTLGVMIALWLFSRTYQKTYKELSLLTLMDLLALPTALVATCIRLGNFMNQEIVGPVTQVSWGVIFGHPWGEVGGVPRHPVQLYEAASYFGVFVLLGILSKKELKQGARIGLFFILVFGSRFFLEYFKNSMGVVFDENILTTGQLLSVPFVILGVWLVMRRGKTVLTTKNPSC